MKQESRACVQYCRYKLPALPSVSGGGDGEDFGGTVEEERSRTHMVVVVIMIGRRVGKKKDNEENEKKKKEKHILFISIIPSIYHQRIAELIISSISPIIFTYILATSIGLNRILEIDSSLGYTKYIICTSTTL